MTTSTVWGSNEPSKNVKHYETLKGDYDMLLATGADKEKFSNIKSRLDIIWSGLTQNEKNEVAAKNRPAENS